MVSAGQIAEALDVVRAIKRSDYRDSALKGIAEVMVNAGQADKALHIARGIEDA